MTTVGRERELQAIGAFLSGDVARVLLVDGEAGIGKTTLCRAVATRAEEDGYRVLSCTAAEAETQLSFTSLRDLVNDVFEEIEGELPEPQRHALAVALLREESTVDAMGHGPLFVGLRSALHALACRDPTIVVVDDTQWLDGPSAHALRYAIRRVDDKPLRFCLARRSGLADPLATAGLTAERVVALDVGALSLGALGRLLHDRLGTVYPRPTLARLHGACGGNPFYALVLARALHGRPLRPSEALPVHAGLPQLVRERFTTLPAPTLDALAVASALSRPSLTLVGEALDTDAEQAMQQAVAAELVELDEDRVWFAHPLFAAAAYDLLSRRRREQIHARLAELVPDLEEKARHLARARSSPDEAAARVLESAAHVASARGAGAAAAELAEEAHRLTPPSDVGRRSARALDAGWFQFIVGDSAGARALLEEAERIAPPGELRARARTRLGWLEHHAGDRRLAVSRYEAALEDTRDPSQRAQIFSLLAWSYSITRRDAAKAAHYARLAVALCDDALDDPILLADSLSVLAQAEFFLGGGLPSAAMERALEIPPSDADLRVLRRPTNHWALMLLCADRFEEARPLFEEVHQLALTYGDESAVPWPLMRLCQLELATGDWGRARAYAEDGLEAAIQTGQAPVRADLTCVSAVVLAHLGLAEEARARATEGLTIAEASGSGIGARLAEWSLGMLDLTLGDPDAAVARLGPLWERSKGAGILDPGENRYIGDLGEALVLTGDVERAEEVARELAGLGTRLKRASATGSAQRVLGLAAEARGETDRALATLAVAMEAQADAGLPFELARTQLALGTVQRRARRRRDARSTLARALAAFEELGAELWARKARAELGRIGGRAPSSDGLTPTEARVAALVVEGKTNKEAAASLVVSVHTIEATLTSIYRKLDVRSRTELAHKLAPSD